MKRWILSVLFSIFLSCPAVSYAAGDAPDLGKATLIDLELFKFPFGANPDSNAVKEKKGEGEARYDEKKEKEIQEKKVDDAIRKAWEGK
jgi:hypothetical protein